jgi:uncharacterized damage-inducible protein DinB
MSLNQILIAELKQESASTRRMLERVPCENGTWKPHEKSMNIGRLAAHVAELPGWISMIMTTPELDFAVREFKPAVFDKTEDLLSFFDKKVDEAATILANAAPEEFGNNWTLRNGEHIIFTMPKAVVLRSYAYSHQYHHRGQLSVYLRLLNIPVPGMYGPTADDNN